ncbi:MAG: RpiR family transcriptional regulator [Cereibacter sphaeroides]|uniref:RpiR family transcriptional regulator n=1 Tax=Cereibacter sphaeroides TaxID=1063 RepID=A0A2W5U8C3_CERSP|nr:MAG: RpiR family transcriptional regulator [Cereibacter sphaeroides]
MDTRPSASAPKSVEQFRERLTLISDDLPKRLRQCAEFIADNTERIAVSTVAEIAFGAGVPPSALMRFCQIMGFSGYSEMQKLFREAYAPGWPDYATRLKNLRLSGSGSPGALLAEFLEAGRLSLETLAKTMDDAALNSAVAALVGADTIHIVGLRRTFPVASYLAYVFEKMQVPAMLHDGLGKLDHRFALRPGDAVLAISFAPYSEETIALARDARARGLKVVALTDQPQSPLSPLATAVLTVPEVDFGAFRSLTATLALALTLAVAVGSMRG